MHVSPTRAWQIHRFGEGSELKLEQVPQLEPGPGEVRLRVEASSLAFTDTLLRRGIYPGMPPTLPLTLGYDAIGRIEALGPGVSTWQKGDRVAALTISGANADVLIHAAAQLVPVPESVTAAAAESLILSWVTAWQMLKRLAQVQRGARVLIHGAAGGVGHALVRLARLQGLQIVTTSSARDQNALITQGVVASLDYRASTLAEALVSHGPYDAIFDAVGPASFWRSYRLLAPQGQLICYGFSGPARGVTRTSHGVKLRSGLMLLRALPLLLASRRVHFYDIKALARQQPDWFRADLGELFALLEAGQIQPQINTVDFGDQQAVRETHQRLTEGGLWGRWVMVHPV